MKHAVRCIAAVAPVIACAAVLAGEGAKAPATPEDAVAELEAATRAGDLDRVLAVFAEPARSTLRSMYAVMARGEAAHRALAQAADARFGKAEDAQLAAPRQYDLSGARADMKQTRSVKIAKREAAGDDVRLELEFAAPTGPPVGTYIARRQGQGWPLLPREFAEWGPEQAKDAEETAAEFAKHAAAIEQLATDVRAGKYETREAVREAAVRIP